MEMRKLFLPRFVAQARSHLARASDAAGPVAREMHALAGEAAVMELVDVAGLAREAEGRARAGEATGEILRRIEAAIGELERGGEENL